MSKSGRPSELTDAVIDEIAAITPHVLFLEPIAATIGKTRQTLYNWMRVGRAELKNREKGKPANPSKDLHVKLYLTLEAKRAEAESNALKGIIASGKSQWQAYAWVLERAFPTRWGKDATQIKDLTKQLKELQDHVLGSRTQK